mmetsp:Transcript_21481/g.52455  ORF Transcript_21481/g.52455 Transcript_21481/m.52455 type:complete len:421 (+) Transcript_21481:137-1399(+)
MSTLKKRTAAANGAANGAAKDGQMEMLIGDRVYDVSEFAKRHPGGSIIKFGVGEDVTEMFKEFHCRVEDKAERYLKQVPSRAATDADRRTFRRDAVMDDFAALRAQLEREGYFEPSRAHFVYRVVELVVMHAVSAYLMLYGGFPLLGAALFGISNGRCGWFMHECGHGSMTGVPLLDKKLQVFFYGLGNSMSASYWNNQHNKHHATPQKLQHDVDLRTLPLVAFDAEVPRTERASGATRAWLRLQHVLFAPVSTFLVVLGWAFYLHPRHALRRGAYDELACMALRHVLVFTFLTPPQFLLMAWCGGAYIFLNFALSHTHRPVAAADAHPNWVEYSAHYTVNIEGSWWCDWWMGYLNYQIEHHLFPAMPQFRQREIAPRVRALFEKHGYTYHCISYWEGLRRTFVNLHEVGNEKESTVKKL